MKKNGFTLIELVGAIVILAIIALVAFPAVTSVLNRESKKLDTGVQEVLEAAAFEYVNQNINSYPKQLEGGAVPSYNIMVCVLKRDGYIDDSLVKKHPEIANDSVTVKANTEKYTMKYKADGGNASC